MDIKEIEVLIRHYATQRGELAAQVQQLNDLIETAKRSKMAAIKQAVADTAEAHGKLQTAIKANPELFKKPKTITVSGVRAGFKKQPGKVVIEDEAATVQRIKDQLPEEQAELLITTTEKVLKSAVNDLSAGDLKRLGITVTADTDQVLIKAVDGDVDKLVNAMLKQVEEMES